MAEKRVSLACVPCREKHLRCDATRPVCRRCATECKDCHYAKSRRGGLDKATLAARRERLARNESALSESALLTPPHQPDVADPLIARYYDTFHSYHPIVLPRQRMKCAIESEGRLKPVVSAMRLIGATYLKSSELSQLSRQLDEDIANQPLDPYTVQAQLLQAIHAFWSSEKPKSAESLAQAIQSATALGMHEKYFAAASSNGDPVLGESWRRTWWSMYIIDATISHINHENVFACRDVVATAELPCEDWEYEACVGLFSSLVRTNPQTIPASLTLTDYKNREFTGREFSSLAYSVGIARDVARVLKEAPPHKDNCHSAAVVDAFDAVADGWLMLLPEGKRCVMNDGTMDEVMFFAHMGLHAYVLPQLCSVLTH